MTMPIQGNSLAASSIDDESSSDIELPTVNMSASHLRRQRLSSRRQSPGLLDKLTKDVTSMYKEMTSSGAATSAERADLDLTQQLERMEDMADDMLEKLAEYCELLEMLRTRTSATLNQDLPKTYEAIQELREVYKTIDRVEEVVRTAEGLTDGLENAVVRAENELTPTTTATIKKFFRTLSPFGLPKSDDESSWIPLEYHRAPVLSLNGFFPVTNDNSVADPGLHAGSVNQ